MAADTTCTAVIGPAVLHDWLRGAAPDRPTPAYVYDARAIRERVGWLTGLISGLLEISFAIKSNPNPAILRLISGRVGWLDASSWAEVHRALDAGKPATRITWSGPGKRPAELAAAVAAGVAIVAESPDEIEQLAALTACRPAPHPVLLRVNPDHVPRGFGANMSGRPSQFGVDEDRAPEAIALIDAAPGLHLAGLHVYTGSNALSPDPVIENFANMARIFLRLGDNGTRRFDKLIFGSGFGIPYHQGQTDLDVRAIRDGIAPILRDLRDRPGLADTAFLLEMGRWLIGPCGALVTRVLSRKSSRGQEIAVCDAGFNNHLAACGMMGATFRKDYPIRALTAGPPEITETIRLTGPLCTSIDALAGPLELPVLRRGDAIAILQSGAYGLTASPTRFISHPDPVEILADDDGFTDISETRLNHVLD